MMNVDDVRIASPCRASWDKMKGDHRRRFCDRCRLNVYNFAGMARSEIAALLYKTEGRLCARLYRRGDGTILTKNCPEGRWGRVRRGLLLLAGLATAFCVGLWVGAEDSASLRRLEPFPTLRKWWRNIDPEPVMGTVCPPPARDPLDPLASPGPM